MATLIDIIDIQVANSPALTIRPRASWLVAASDMSTMSGTADTTTYRDACAPANAAAKGLSIHGANGRKPFTRRPEDLPT